MLADPAIRFLKATFDPRIKKIKSLRLSDSGRCTFIPYDNHKCIFVHIPKTAGISVGRALFGKKWGGHHTIEEYRYAYDKKTFDSYFKFTFVRHPIDRLFSAYSFLKKGGLDQDDARWAQCHLQQHDSFESFIQNWLTPQNASSWIHFIPQTHFLTLSGQIAVDFIGRVENIEHDFNFVANRLGIATTITHSNKSTDTSQREAISPEAIKIIHDVYADDFRNFGYE